MVLNIIAFIFRDQDFFKRCAFLLTHPVACEVLLGSPGIPGESIKRPAFEKILLPIKGYKSRISKTVLSNYVQYVKSGSVIYPASCRNR